MGSSCSSGSGPSAPPAATVVVEHYHSAVADDASRHAPTTSTTTTSITKSHDEIQTDESHVAAAPESYAQSHPQHHSTKIEGVTLPVPYQHPPPPHHNDDHDNARGVPNPLLIAVDHRSDDAASAAPPAGVAASDAHSGAVSNQYNTTSTTSGTNQQQQLGVPTGGLTSGNSSASEKPHRCVILLTPSQNPLAIHPMKVLSPAARSVSPYERDDTPLDSGPVFQDLRGGGVGGVADGISEEHQRQLNNIGGGDLFVPTPVALALSPPSPALGYGTNGGTVGTSFSPANSADAEEASVLRRLCESMQHALARIEVEEASIRDDTRGVADERPTPTPGGRIPPQHGGKSPIQTSFIVIDSPATAHPGPLSDHSKEEQDVKMVTKELQLQQQQQQAPPHSGGNSMQQHPLTSSVAFGASVKSQQQQTVATIIIPFPDSGSFRTDGGGGGGGQSSYQHSQQLGSMRFGSSSRGGGGAESFSFSQAQSPAALLSRHLSSASVSQALARQGLHVTASTNAILVRNPSASFAHLSAFTTGSSGVAASIDSFGLGLLDAAAASPSSMYRSTASSRNHNNSSATPGFGGNIAVVLSINTSSTVTSFDVAHTFDLANYLGPEFFSFSSSNLAGANGGQPAVWIGQQVDGFERMGVDGGLFSADEPVKPPGGPSRGGGGGGSDASAAAQASYDTFLSRYSRGSESISIKDPKAATISPNAERGGGGGAALVPPTATRSREPQHGNNSNATVLDDGNNGSSFALFRTNSRNQSMGPLELQ